MTTPAELSQALLDTVTERKDHDTVDKIVGAVKTLAETEKLRLEGEKFRVEAANMARVASSANRRFFLTVLAPSLSALAVLLALGVQVRQVNQTATLQRETNDATNLREALKLVESKEPREALAGSLFLTSLLRSPNYGLTARAVVISVLANAPDKNTFIILLRALLATSSWNNLTDIVHVGRSIDDARYSLSHPTADVVPTLPTANGTVLDAESSDVSDGLCQFLLDHTRPSNVRLDLQTVPLGYENLSGVNFSGANLTHAVFIGATLRRTNLAGATVTSADLNNADLDEVVAFESSNWEGTAWWRAKTIGPKLLVYLKTRYPFSSTAAYYAATLSGDDPSTDEVYRQNVSRLEGAKH